MFGLVTLVNGVKKLVDISTSPLGVSLPNGYIYVQFPGTQPPADLFGGTWQLQTMYNAQNSGSIFNSGKQGYSVNTRCLSVSICPAGSHTHCCVYYANASCSAWGCWGSTYVCDGHLHSVSLSTGCAETRPDNYTIQIWKKTAD